jgi:hypothetical protein
MRLRIDASNRTLIAGSDPVKASDGESCTQPEHATRGLGRAYRAGRLVCGCVHVTVSLDGRLGLTPHERRLMRVRFNEPLDDGLRAELAQLVRRRGAGARRAAESFHEIAIALDDPDSERVRFVGRLQPPQVRHGQLSDIEFGLGDLR